MNPLPWLKAVWAFRKLIGYGLAVLAMSILAWRIASWRTGYLKLGEAEEALHKEQQGRLDDRKTYTENIVKAEKEAQALAKDLGNIRTRFANLATIVPKTLIRTAEVPRDSPTCPVPRVSPEFVRMYNDAGKP